MTEHLSSKDSRQDGLASQDLGIKDSHITNTDISQAGRDSYKADGNITKAQYLQQNYYVQKVISSSSKNKGDLETIKELERAVEYKYSEKFSQVASIVSELRAQVENQLSALPEKYQDESIKLLDDLQSIVGDELDLDEIRKELLIYRKASNWLYENVDILIDTASEKIFSGKYRHLLKPRKSFLGIQKITDRDIHTIEVKDRFSNDLNAYIGWILSYMPNGSNPKGFNSSFVCLDFEDNVYKQAFEIMKDDEIAPEKSNIPIDEARIIARYINKFIIDRNLSKDARRLF